MAIPDYQTIMLPLLQHTADGEIYTSRGLKGPLADHFGLTAEERERMLPSGQQTYFHNRLAWAKTYLDRAGIIQNVSRGRFTITDRGRELLNSNVAQIDNSTLLQFPEFKEFCSRSKSSDDKEFQSATISSEQDAQTPEEALQLAYKRVRDDLAAEIIDQIKAMSPTFFEQLVLDLMVNIGYGGTGSSASLTNAGADGGIDGVINEDKLGLDIIYLQAKRWENQVGRPEIQKFVGALHGKRARKGVFLTTSTFSRDAHEYVATIDPKVVLVDGRRLAQLMIDFNVGVSTAQTFEIKRIDSDYFSED